jgi:hypothetical protein
MAMIARYLDVADATVESVSTERGPRVRVVGRDPRAPGLSNVSNYRVEALLTESGRVERLGVAYLAANGSLIRAGVHVQDVGAVVVDSPVWYDEARAATLGPGAVTSAPNVTPNASAAFPPRQARPSRSREAGDGVARVRPAGSA